MKVLVTGGCGFIGSNLIRYLLRSEPDWSIINVDLLTYAGNLDNLRDIPEGPRYRFVRADIGDRETIFSLLREEKVEAIVHLAAESHVDRSIEDATTFLRTNILGTHVLLESLRHCGVSRLVACSTDEVYGSINEGLFTEESPLRPNSSYAASKASSDLLCRAYHKTYGLPVVITRCTNNFGPYQFPEKLIPLFIINALQDKPLPLYGDGLYVRDWIYVEDHCAALALVLKQGREGEIYNIGAGNEKTNREITALILAELGKPETLVRYVADRPGHDRRYALKVAKIRQELGWGPAHGFAHDLCKTMAWYRENPWWWEAIKKGEYQTYYERMYGQRLQQRGGSHGS
jgi:dTDP-glucose 4,6-dehydratase